MGELVEFAVSFPVWLVLGSPQGDPDQSGFSWDSVLTGEVRGKRTLIIFTDDDLLVRFLSMHPQDADLKPVAFANPLMLIAILRILEGMGIATHLAIDPWYDTIRVRPSLRECIHKLAEKFLANQTDDSIVEDWH